MKVSIEQTVEVTDEQRYELAQVLEHHAGKRRQATRAELKEWIWEHGANWSRDLALAVGVDPNPPEDDPFDLDLAELL